ncbi:hybrid sensor histidine kinase/response regulator [Photobacterium rosenbergii]|uniref:histidine kinase n=1 Tax=Photobacterium rosenbergii TaxID=294936 RepID=A0A2T3NG04_9GAMM|nr:response regulator [Photobacterium rosenbergii]PSW13503.1 hybrid sensor histidine kinase/response regulator [Photobacterium rosenbergii]
MVDKRAVTASEKISSLLSSSLLGLYRQLLTRKFLILMGVVSLSLLLMTAMLMLLVSSESPPSSVFILVNLLLPLTIFVLVAGYLFHSRVTRPIALMAEQLSLVGKGQVTLQELTDKDSEIGHLARQIQSVDSKLFYRNNKLLQLNEALERQSIQLKKAYQVKSEFMANMSHELRTPMNGILGFIQCLQQKNLGRESNQQVEYIKDSAFTLLTLINEVLNFSRLESDRVELCESDCNLSRLVQSCVNSVAQEASLKGLKIEVNLPEEERCDVHADGQHLRQILTNLLSNAVKFTDQGFVKVSIDWLREEANEIEVCIRVIDSGIGISDCQCEEIFDAYSQIDGSISRQYGGTGLGLAVSSRLCDLLGSKLKVVSQKGVGSEFSFRLRLKKALNTTEPQSVALSSDEVCDLSKFSHCRILVAEDQYVNQQLVIAFLKSMGLCNIDVVDNGEEAVNYLDKNLPDLILMDCQMPVMGGLEATRKIREKQNCAQLPIIALTANVLESEKQQCFDAGMDAYLAKPIIKINLFSTLLSVLSADAVS